MIKEINRLIWRRLMKLVTSLVDIFIIIAATRHFRVFYKFKVKKILDKRTDSKFFAFEFDKRGAIIMAIQGSRHSKQRPLN